MFATECTEAELLQEDRGMGKVRMLFIAESPAVPVVLTRVVLPDTAVLGCTYDSIS